MTQRMEKRGVSPLSPLSPPLFTKIRNEKIPMSFGPVTVVPGDKSGDTTYVRVSMANYSPKYLPIEHAITGKQICIKKQCIPRVGG
jgi:hypothetical protein